MDHGEIGAGRLTAFWFLPAGPLSDVDCKAIACIDVASTSFPRVAAEQQNDCGTAVGRAWTVSSWLISSAEAWVSDSEASAQGIAGQAAAE